MRTVKIAILTAVLIGLAGLVACNDKDADEQQNSSSKAAAGQQTAAQKPAGEADKDEGEDGEEGPATPGAVAAEKPARQQSSGKEFIYNFDGDTSGQLPAKFHAARTGSGAESKWVVMGDPTAPSKPNVVAQTSTDQTDYRFPLLIVDEGSFQDLDLSVRFKAVSGSIDQAGGLVFRLKDANNYYVVRANALENNYRLYHVVNGRRREFAGANFKVTAGDWHELRVEVAGNKITCYYDGAKEIETTDDTFKDAGKVGLWTKADSVTYFDDLKVRAKQTPSQMKGTDMKNTKLSSIRTCTLAVAIISLVSLSINSAAQATGDQKAAGEWKTVEDVFGFAGANLPGGVVRFNMPRKDLHVTLEGTEIKPGLALGAWAAFHHVGNNDAMVMGDLVLTEDEVAPVMNALLDGGVEVTAIHNHLVGESPKIIYVHMGGHGDPVKMAQTIKQAVGLTKTPVPQGAGTKETAADLAFDVAAVEKIMGRPGNVSGGVLHFGAPRAEKLTEEGMDTPPSMGAGTVINFQPTGNGRAAIAGDFAMTGKEVGPVMKVLHDNGIQAVALHSHALDDAPRLFYMHFWANDDAVKLAKGLRAALDNTNSAK